MSRVQPAHAPITWRPVIGGRIGYSAVFVMFLLLTPSTVGQVRSPCSGEACWAGDGPRIALIIGVLVTLVGGSFFLSAAFTMARLESDRLVVRRLWWRQTVVPLVEITRADTTNYLGVRISRESGKPFVIWALQQSNLWVMLGREGRADRAAAQIVAAAERARSARS